MTLLGAIFAGAGALELAIGLYLFSRTRSFLEQAVSAQGKVIGFEESYSSDTGTTYRPVIEFTSAEGQTRRFTDSMGSNPPGLDEGETVPVKYEHSNPERARIDKPFRLWFVSGLLVSMGLLFAVLGLIFLAVGG